MVLLSTNRIALLFLAFAAVTGPASGRTTRNLSDCQVSSSVTCEVTSTGTDCEDLVIPLAECRDIDMTFIFEYCNDELTDLKFRTERFRALVETLPLEGFDLTDLPSGECRTFAVPLKIDTCKRFFSSSLKIEGWRDAGAGDYCYAYDFKRIFVKRPCEITSEISCVDQTGEDCKKLIVPLDECGREDMTFTFEYCNNEETSLIFITPKFRALVETLPLETDGFDLTDLPSGGCRRRIETLNINTCKRFFSSSLKVEGYRGDGAGAEDYCYAYDFNRIYFIRGGD